MSTRCMEPNTGIRAIEYQRNTLPIPWGFNPNSEGWIACCEVLVMMRDGPLTGTGAMPQKKRSAAGRISAVAFTEEGC